MNHIEQILVIMGFFAIIIGICFIYNYLKKFFRKLKK